MTASHKLAYPPIISQIPKHGVLAIQGYGVHMRMQRGHLEIEDGVGPERRSFRLPRVGHRLRRVVCISEDGFITLSALKWLSDIGVPFIMLDRLGKVRLLTGPTSSNDSRLRRAQGLAVQNGVGLRISRELIDAKLQGQERVLREQLNALLIADTISHLRTCDLPEAETFERVRTIEAHAALAYFNALRNTPITWPKADSKRIPEHWHTAGTRQSPLSGSPRLAVTPFHAVLNFCFALLESEARLAVSAVGLDATLGLGLHTDTPHRDSLAFDVLEPVRPQVESWLISWVGREPLLRADFYEAPTGNCRLMSCLCSKLSETAPVWGKLVAPWAEYVARSLWNSISRPQAPSSPPTPLTQQRRREAKGSSSLPTVKSPKPEHFCRGCGKSIRDGRTHCADCAAPDATKRLAIAAHTGRVVAHSPAARAKEGQKQRQHANARSSWKRTGQAGITPEHYRQRIQPLLTRVSTSMIARAIGVSRWYAGRIRQGYRPHPRHWKALAVITGFKD